jgi:hypothetical protein
MTVAPQIKLVIPERDEVASPESIEPQVLAERWIPGSMLRIAPE